MLLSPSLLAEGQTRYISDDIYIFIHGGPGNQYRILGSIEAGEKITLLPETDGDYAKIVDPKGREGWVRTDKLQTQVSMRYRMADMEKQLADAQSKLQTISSQNSDVSTQLDNLQSKLNKTQADLTKATTERDNAIAKLENMQDNARFHMWQQGGLIAAGGLILGVILVYLPRPQRRRRNRWM
ncbi:TIGR04211 family SH3 domain-containing protein [Shewanella yunxiaonensis]|uniref:TIGR04211 family SH3 domain-containing protein n=2 Tax=Shewanella yunxiaonensis TaxID=2829809 RepID=A0ABX7YYI1_9GAMM|nr:TIGR04211 family SH3 domain-containing protein [Shewanella sp. A32]MDF0533131.1 TIGR04211 family SH3 domain-containing protein [Shewanella sp. A32]QUN07508.1 TIGR04211 family SH3 domain-containing protein [Shewanella yunxiaonensis]